MVPKLWSQGQLFAFSALDGPTHFEDDLSGILCGEKLGIRFFTKVRRELVITGIRGFVPEFEAVTGDLIAATTPEGSMHILFAQAHLIVGNTAAGTQPVMITEGAYQQILTEGILIHDTGDGDLTGLYRNGDYFAFAYGHSVREVTELTKTPVDLMALKAQRLQLFQDVSLPDYIPYATLYAKCLSTMKTQLYTPEGDFRHIWSTPDRLPHKRLWLWDSVFHAIGHRNIHPTLAEDLILSLFDVQSEDGFIPHMASPQKRSAITQPPVIGWGAWLVYKKSGNKAFLRQVLHQNKAFLLWCQANRRESDAELYTWKTTNIVTCRCDECGMDNSPRFDKLTLLEAIDFSCFMANDVRYMAKIATELGETQEAAFFQGWFDAIRDAINQKLWCEADGFYYDYDIQDQQLHKVRSVASFLPLFAGVCDTRQARKLLEQIQDPDTFCTPMAIPSISKQDPTYGTDMWRGAVWINYNYMIANGLEEYGYHIVAESIRVKTFRSLDHWYQQTGTLYEFYDPENLLPPSKLNRKGPAYEPYDFTVRMQSIRDYGWTNTLCFDILHRRFSQWPKGLNYETDQ